MSKKGRYNVYSDHLKNKYGEKVYKLPVNLPGGCPNRDGTVTSGGCIFCDEKGSGFQCLPNSMSIEEQVAKNKAFFTKRFKAKKFIVYFQAFTNTYWPLDIFKSFIRAASHDEDVVAISISTRPDCINDDYLDFLQKIRAEKGVDINIELGLQTVNYHTLKKINRGHTLAEFIDAVIRIKKHGFLICAHLILNLPWDDENDVIENSKIISAFEIEYVKLHSLYIVEGTKLGEMYKKGEFEVISLKDYINSVVTFLEHLHPDTVVQRLVGKGPQDKLLFSNWNTSWWYIKEQIENELEVRDTWQGKKCNYLNGKALARWRNSKNDKY
ncbi:MAG: uncharacterized protein PWQ96_44 [Clostridia bacterium]|jgi:hypothetical protein|nr:conserved hypothetical radical protein [Clostridiales bacterium]MDK2984402.1 uncharacterized protein [Clostridia bacterium]